MCTELQCSILLAVTTVLYLLPTPMVSFSIYSSTKCVWGVRTCVFIPGHVWSCDYLVWMWWRIDRAQLKWRALRCVQSKQWGANHGSTAFHRSHLIGYYQKADCHDGEKDPNWGYAFINDGMEPVLFHCYWELLTALDREDCSVYTPRRRRGGGWKAVIEVRMRERKKRRGNGLGTMGE